MPQVFKIGPYRIYFWSNENDPLEPVPVHIVEGEPRKDATKVWITQSGKCLLANNRSQSPERILNHLLRFLEANSGEIVERWYHVNFQIFCN